MKKRKKLTATISHPSQLLHFNPTNLCGVMALLLMVQLAHFKHFHKTKTSKLTSNCFFFFFILDETQLNAPSIHLQMKYWACLRIFTEELCGMFLTTSVGRWFNFINFLLFFKSEGSRLKEVLYTWLENEISTLHKICSSNNTNGSSAI